MYEYTRNLLYRLRFHTSISSTGAPNPSLKQSYKYDQKLIAPVLIYFLMNAAAIFYIKGENQSIGVKKKKREEESPLVYTSKFLGVGS